MDVKVNSLPCEDLSAFEEALMKLRKIDDHIIYALNTTVPVNTIRTNPSQLSSDCSSLWDQLNTSYMNRENALKKCVSLASGSVAELKAQREKQESIETIKRLKKEQTKLRIFEKELGVEEIIRNRSKKVFYERCRNYFKPPVDAFV
ncbi:coiled-coil domain-containing 58 [Brevipalpus obovatus]|uniref:coiled-coil domain-containing 58 n=1 Tax=Brevipalpus obovatus TaxID=246614 RepID=UPI003D9E0B6C